MPGKTTQLGYGNQHQRSRREAFPLLPEWSPCCRCGRPMWKWEREKYRRGTRSALHYDHNDARSGYLGFSHRLCNLKAGGRRRWLIARTQRAPYRVQSRAWT